MPADGFEAADVWKAQGRGFQMAVAQHEGQIIHFTGQVAWDANENIIGKGNVAEQTRVALILADALPFGAPQQFAAGAALIRAGRAPEALRYLERGLQYKPADLNTLLALSHARVLTGDFDGARVSLQRVIDIDPDNATARDALSKLPLP